MLRNTGPSKIFQCLVTLLLLCLAGLLSLTSSFAAEAEESWFKTDDQGEIVIQLHFFWSKNCPHCHNAFPFIEHLAKNNGWLQLHAYELTQNRDNVVRYIELARQVGADAQSVPAFIFCNQILTGFDSAEGIGAMLRQRLLACKESITAQGTLPADIEAAPLSLPLVGAINVETLSLPVLTLVIAGMDAFNPCAFFVLLFLLSLLVHAGSRKRMFLIGGVFVLFSALVYFVFMAAWLNVFMWMGEVQALTLIAGLLAIVIASINIKDYFWLKAGVSLSIPDAAKPGLFARMRHLVNAENIPALLIGTVLLALVANSYELLCTAGFPMVYTRILTLNELSPGDYYLYLAAYNLIYIIPLAVIVMVFALTLGACKLSEREGRRLKLVSGLMMLGLGLLLLFAPALLNNVLAALGLLTLAFGASAVIIGLERLHKRPA